MNIGFASDLKPTAKLIYLVIADFANDEGECFPSQTKIAKKASVSISTTKYYIKAFEKLGIIKTEQLYRNNGSKSSLLYKINTESKNLEKNRIENAYKECRKKRRRSNSYTETIPQKGKKEDHSYTETIPQNRKNGDTASFLNVTVQNANCDGLESSYINHQSLDEEEVSKYFADFYAYLNSIGVIATKSKQMHMNRIRTNLLKGHKSTLENFNDFLLVKTASDTA